MALIVLTAARLACLPATGSGRRRVVAPQQPQVRGAGRRHGRARVVRLIRAVGTRVETRVGPAPHGGLSAA